MLVSISIILYWILFTFSPQNLELSNKVLALASGKAERVSLHRERRNQVEPRCAVIDAVACKARTVAWLQGKTCGDDEQFDLLASLW